MSVLYKDDYHRIDSGYVAEQYREHSRLIARCMGQLEDALNKINYLSEVTKDNGDPGFELGEAIAKLGMALACCVTYCEEYEEEENDNEGVEDEETKKQ